MVMYKNLHLGLALREALAWIGASAQQEGNGKAAELALDLVNALPPDADVTVHVPVVAALVHAVDDYRTRGATEIVAKLEALLQALKGPQQRTISGQLHFRPSTVSELDQTLETLRSQLTKKP